MNNKGYTLVELLIVISLLAVFSIISFISIIEVINKNKYDNCVILIDNLKSAAKEYVSDNRYNENFNPEKNKEINLNLSILFEKGYLRETLIDPYMKEVMDVNDFIVDISLHDDYTVNEVLVLYNYGSEYREYVCGINNS